MYKKEESGLSTPKTLSTLIWSLLLNSGKGLEWGPGTDDKTLKLYLLWVHDCILISAFLETVSFHDFSEGNFRPCGRSMTEIFLTKQTFKHHFQRHHGETESAYMQCHKNMDLNATQPLISGVTLSNLLQLIESQFA